MLVLILALSLLGGVDAECFANQRLPKAVQTSQEFSTANVGAAIASSDALNAIFTGGSIT